MNNVQEIRKSFWEAWDEKTKIKNELVDLLMKVDHDTLKKIVQLDARWHDIMLAFGKVTEAGISLD